MLRTKEVFARSGALNSAPLDITEHSTEIALCRASHNAIHDHEGFCGVELGEYESLENVATIAALVEEHEKLGAEVYKYFGDIQKALAALSENYGGEFDSVGDWAECYLDETGGLAGVPTDLRGYIDFDSYGEDQETNGVIFTLEIDGRVHVFYNR